MIDIENSGDYGEAILTQIIRVEAYMISKRVSIPVGEKEFVSGILTLPEKYDDKKGTGIIISHGAGNDMYNPLIVFLAEGLADAGYYTLRFNFPYRENGRKAPDPQRTLVLTWQCIYEFFKEEAGCKMNKIIATGKSMGGRVASQMVAEGLLPVDGLVFFGYPLHSPGKSEKIRDAHLYQINIPMLFFDGTHRLRNLINKGNTEENLLNTARHGFDAGWKSLKLYFMLGLPTETEADLEGIVALAYKVLREGEEKRQVTISLSTFIPKPHTPFQWQRQIGLDEIQEKQTFFKKNIRHRNLNLKWHDGRMSLLEGVLSRGSKNVGNLIAKAFTLGCRFDGWSDQFRFDLWEQAMQASNINIADYLKEKNLSEMLIG